MMRMRRGPGLVRGVARTAAVVGTATAVSGRVARRQDQKFSAQDQAAAEQQEAAMPAAPDAPAPAQDDTVEQLKQLAALKDQGILTEAEFTAKKDQILGI